MWPLSCFGFFVLMAHCTSSVFSEKSHSSHAKGSQQSSEREKEVESLRQCDPDYRYHIPYTINDGLSAETKKGLHKSFDHYTIRTCVLFDEVQSFHNLDSRFDNSLGIIVSSSYLYDLPYPAIRFRNNDGRNMTQIRLNRSLSVDDAETRTNQQLYYAFGFLPEHTRKDRDEYVSILTDNIDPEWKILFERRIETKTDHSYDYESVGNFYPTDCGKDGKETIKWKTSEPVKKNLYLSEQDESRINEKYCQPC